MKEVKELAKIIETLTETKLDFKKKEFELERESLKVAINFLGTDTPFEVRAKAKAPLNEIRSDFNRKASELERVIDALQYAISELDSFAREWKL